MKASWILHNSAFVDSIVLCCFACCIFHIASIPFNYGGKAVRVVEAMMGSNLVSQISYHNLSPGSLAFLTS